MAGSTPAGAGAGFAGAGVGDALAVASGFLTGVASSGEAAGSTVAPVDAGAAFGFAGAGVGAALAVALGFLAGITPPGEAAGSAVAPTGAGAAVDPGGHTVQFQHSALAGNDRNASPVAATSPVSRSDFSFIDSSPVRFFDVLFTPIFPACSIAWSGKCRCKRSSALGPYRILLAGRGLASDDSWAAKSEMIIISLKIKGAFKLAKRFRFSACFVG